MLPVPVAAAMFIFITGTQALIEKKRRRNFTGWDGRANIYNNCLQYSLKRHSTNMTAIKSNNTNFPLFYKD